MFRIPILRAAGVVTVVTSLGLATGVAGAVTAPRDVTAEAHSRAVAGDTAGQRSYAVVGAPYDYTASSNSFDIEYDVTHGSMFGFNFLSGPLFGSAVSPSGDSAILAEASDSVTVLSDVSGENNVPEMSIPLSQFVDEGAIDAVPQALSDSMTNDTALVAIGGPAVIQLRRAGESWEVDSRVQSPGLNEDGAPHAPGLIRLPAGPHGATTFGSVTVSRVPTKTGHYLGLALDRYHRTLVVLSGVGSAHPKVAATLSQPLFRRLHSVRYGQEGLAFSSVSATKAVFATRSGLAIVDLSKPTHPTIRPMKIASAVRPEGIAVAPDGDHVALMTESTIYDYSGLLHSTHKLTPVGSFTPASTKRPKLFDLAFLNNGTLLIGDATVTGSDTTYVSYLSRVSGIETDHPSAGSTDPLGSAGGYALSAYPGIQPPTITPPDVSGIKSGHHVTIKIHVANGVGTYSLGAVTGKLPKGLAFHRQTITGTPTHSGSALITLRAVNQYGGAAFATIVLNIG